MRIQRTGPSKKPAKVETRGLAVIAVTALAIIALTFRTWVDFNIASLRGIDADAITKSGDGYFVIALAVLAIACAGLVHLRPKLWSVLLPGIGLSSVAIAAIAGFVAATPWNVSGFDVHGAFVNGGHATAAVYEVFAVASVMGVFAAALAGRHYQRPSPDPGAAMANGPGHANGRLTGRHGIR